MAAQIIVRLEAKHSPEQICGGLALTGQQVSNSKIYRHLHEDRKAGGELHLNLRINGHRRYRHRNKASRVKIPNRRDISERPAVVARRTRYGDWEADLIEVARGTGYILSALRAQVPLRQAHQARGQNQRGNQPWHHQGTGELSRPNHHLRQWPRVLEACRSECRTGFRGIHLQAILLVGERWC